MLNRDDLDLLAARLFHMLRPHLVNHTPKWMSMAEACEYARMSRDTMTKLIDEGHVYAKKLAEKSGKYIIDRETIDCFLNNGRVNLIGR